MSTPPAKAEVIRTLVGSGFALKNATPRPNGLVTLVTRTEQLGLSLRYLISFTNCRINRAEVEALVKEADSQKAGLVIVGDADVDAPTVPLLTYEQFFDRLGGPIFSMLPFAPDFSSHLTVLGDNKLPTELQGRADDLFEQYVHGPVTIFGTETYAKEARLPLVR